MSHFDKRFDSVKSAAISVAADILKKDLKLLPGQVFKPEGLDSCYFVGVDPMYLQHVAQWSGIHNSPIPTILSRFITFDHMKDFLLRIIKEIDDEEIRDIEMSALKERYDMWRSGHCRSTRLPENVLGRLLIPDYVFQRRNIPFRRYPTLPRFSPIPIPYVEIRNVSANVGYPYFQSFSRIKERVISDACALVRWMGKRNLRQVVADMPEYWHMLIARNQGGGRSAIGVSKVLNLSIMGFAQGLSNAMRPLDWNFTGDMSYRLVKARLFSKGRPGTVLGDGDDGVVVSQHDGRHLFLSLDASSFDAQVRPLEHYYWLEAVRRALSIDRLWYLYYKLYMVTYWQPILTWIGLLYRPFCWSLLSGIGDVHPFGTTTQVARLRNCPFDLDIERGLSMLRQYGEYRQPKQLIGRHSFTLDQLIYSTWRPGFLHGILSRIGLNALEKENFSREDVVDTEAGLIQTLAMGYTHPKFESLLEFIRDSGFRVRLSSSALVERTLELLNRSKGRDSGKWERAAILKVIAYLSK